MKIFDFFEMYNLHDSLIESIDYNADDKTVKIVVDFCFWQQKDYNENKPETGLIIIKFSNVSEFIYEHININSDEIIDTSVDNSSVEIKFFNEETQKCHSIQICACDVAIE